MEASQQFYTTTVEQVGNKELPLSPPQPQPRKIEQKGAAKELTMVEELNSVKLRSTQGRKERSQLEEVSKGANKEASNKEKELQKIIALHQNIGMIMPTKEHMEEIRDTIGSAKSASKILANFKHPVVKEEQINLNQKSSPQEVQEWLTAKGFSVRVQELLEDLNGIYLFSLSRPKLIQACGTEEGSRLYSQILLLKNKLKYQTPSRMELNAILRHRKAHAERNDTPNDKE
ncbi:unnamed protein product [Thelazia callipaeda]|uniref:SAM_3 domain-containing protein n=1 Tax=Thelazia callipaeda TaxID=103827 RepID=A0A0N5D006_THECL|nr:unnamed protein product [Thelazia callipaeda]